MSFFFLLHPPFERPFATPIPRRPFDQEGKVLRWGGLAVLFAGITGLGPCKAEGVPRKSAEGPLP